MNFEALIGESAHRVKVTKEDGQFCVTINEGEPIHADLIKTPAGYHLVMNGASHHLALTSEKSQYSVQVNGKIFDLKMVSEFKSLQEKMRGTEISGAGTIVAKMPGKIIKVLANVGDEVHDGEAVLIMEAMKMENELRAPSKGKIKEIRVKEGDNVEAGTLLVVME